MDLQRLRNDKLTRRNNSIQAHKIISVERNGGRLNVAAPSYISGGCICGWSLGCVLAFYQLNITWAFIKL